MTLPTSIAVIKMAVKGAIITFFTGLAVTEAFQGQILASIISAIPPTIGVILVMVGQHKMHMAMNSRLDELVEAKRGEARAEGIELERSQERDRQSAAAAAAAAAVPKE